MITAKDMYFHTPTSDDHYWAETNYFGFYIPEEAIHVNVYVLTRQLFQLAPPGALQQ